MRTFFAATLLIAFAVILDGCSTARSPESAGGTAKVGSGENARTAEHEAVADVRVAVGYAGPVIVATARIPLDDSATTKYFLALDGNSLFGERYDNVLPIKPPETKYRFGVAWVAVPFEALGEQINNEAVEASLKKDVAVLERIAGSLRGRVSFFYETTKAAYSDE